MIKRELESIIQSKLGKGKAILLMGARQVGKTTLLKNLFKQNSGVLWLNGDEKDVQELFQNSSSSRLKAFFAKHTIVIIDEAQRIQDIGLRMKLITDQIPEVQLIATGSSAFELANKVNEPLTGRKWEYKMYPLSFQEMVEHHGLLEEQRMLPHRMVFGYYPDVVSHVGDEKEILKQLTESYLYKDVLWLEQVKKPEGMIKLLQALAYQIGSQVSYNELSKTTGIDIKTIEKYIAVLEQTYVIFRLGSLSRNLRSELKKSRKIYFYDNGIRNSLISNLNSIEQRTDTGALWENYLVSERMKFNEYHKRWPNSWFWRTKDQKEIDYIEEKDGLISAYEFKWNPLSKHKNPKSFLNAYTESNFQIIHPGNMEEFLLVGS
jgi:predicted AAA+ superfamily ATPase